MGQTAFKTVEFVVIPYNFLAKISARCCAGGSHLGIPICPYDQGCFDGRADARRIQKA